MKARPIQLRHLALTLLTATLISSSGCSTSRAHEKEIEAAITSLPVTTLSPVDFAYSEILKGGVSPEFAKKLEDQFLAEKKNEESRDQIVELNVLGFLAPGDYSRHYSDSAVKHIRKFIKKYNKTFARAEKEFHVSREIVASLLWVETKHGKTMGTYHLPMVYFSLMQATHPQVAKATLTELNFRKPTSNSSAANMSYTELQQKVIQRLTKKSAWALDQIKMLEVISNKQSSLRNVKSILSVKSSFAGAFGCSQFIPTSYEKYAVSASKKTPNLFDLKDCIYSVANFLNKSGWDPENPKAQSDALFEYNRIRDYGDVIQKLAQAAKTS